MSMELEMALTRIRLEKEKKIAKVVAQEGANLAVESLRAYSNFREAAYPLQGRKTKKRLMAYRLRAEETRTKMRELGVKEEEFKNKAKLISGQVRSSTNEMAEGIRKIEKTANFDKMSNYIDLLERAASAFEKLAELESNGKLDKIIAAIK